MDISNNMYSLVKELFPICRSITGDGVRKTLRIIQREIPELKIFEVPTGSKVFDWIVPKEWNIKGGYIETLEGKKVIDFADTNLHVMGYSLPIDKIVSREELLEMCYTIPEQPDYIPYVTSYYKERSGFCLSEKQKQALTEDTYHVVIDSTLENGSLTYGELLIPGNSKDEIFLSTYVCHPSMANNELSGPAVTVELAKYILANKDRRYSYRIIFIPETIGSITYLSKNLDYLQKHVIAGYNISCVGDDRTYSYVESPYADTLADRVAQNVLNFHYPEYKRYSFLHRGSDERQYCSPLVHLPLCAICRSKYEEYPEYHTSADNLNLVSPNGLYGAFEVYRKCIDLLENNYMYIVTTPCEPQLGKRGLYPTLSRRGSINETRSMTAFIAYADGKHDLVDISNRINVPIDRLLPIIKKLLDNGLIRK
jgi:aminopeptidase-like protein